MLDHLFSDRSEIVTPAFPNWQKSFISGAESPLFEIEHRIEIGNPRHLISRVRFREKAEGPPGHVHGGASAALIDETMGVVVWHNQFYCLTQNLNLQYLKPLPLSLEAFVTVEITLVTERTIEVSCAIQDAKKTPYVSAQGVFHRLKPEQLQKFIDSNSPK